MAEAIGLASSIVGLAAFSVQLAESIAKLKRFCKDVQNAPAELQTLCADVELYSKLFEHAWSADFHNTSIPPEALQSCRELSKQSLERFKTVVADLEAAMSRSKRRGSIKQVLKQDEINRILQNMSRITQNLHFLYNIYTESKNQHQLQCLQNYIAELREGQLQSIQYSRTIDGGDTVANDTKDLDEIESLQDQSQGNTERRIQRSESNRTRTEIQLRLPLWLCQHAWNISLSRSAGNWTISLQAFQTLPPGYFYYRLICEPGIETVTRMLEKRRLSVHDHVEGGDSLLAEACYAGRSDLVELLIQSGATEQPTFAEDSSAGDLLGQAAEVGSTIGRLALDGKSEGKWRVAGLHFDGDQLRTHARLLTDNFDAPYMYHILAMAVSVRTPTERLGAFMTYIFTNGNEIEQLSDWSEWVTTPSACLTNGYSLLHFFVHIVALREEYRDPNIPAVLASVFSSPLIVKADIHLIWKGTGVTPFTFWIFVCLQGENPRQEVRNGVKMWCKVLQDAGIDTEKYIARENEIMKSKAEYGWLPYIRRRGVVGLGWNKSCGRCTVLFEHPENRYATEFWDLIEAPRVNIPGAWIEEHEELDIDSDDYYYWAMTTQMMRYEENILIFPPMTQNRGKIASIKSTRLA